MQSALMTQIFYVYEEREIWGYGIISKISVTSQEKEMNEKVLTVLI